LKIIIIITITIILNNIIVAKFAIVILIVTSETEAQTMARLNDNTHKIVIQILYFTITVML